MHCLTVLEGRRPGAGCPSGGFPVSAVRDVCHRQCPGSWCVSASPRLIEASLPSPPSSSHGVLPVRLSVFKFPPFVRTLVYAIRPHLDVLFNLITLLSNKVTF